MCNKLNIAPGDYSENLEKRGMHRRRVWEYGNLPDVGKEDTKKLERIKMKKKKG